VIVLSMITYNSYTKMRSSIGLKSVLDSTLQVPYKAVILVDDSTDETAEVVKKWCDERGKELVVTRSRLYGYQRPTRATARQTAIDIFFESFSDEWLMFVDDDAYLRNGWWDEARQHIDNPKVGLVWGINWDADPERLEYLKYFGVDYRAYLIRAFEVRGGLHDTMLRRKAIEGIKIRPELHVLEDGYVKWWVQCRGWEIRILETGIMHYNPWRPGDIYRNLKQLRDSIEIGWRYGIVDAVFSTDAHTEYRGLLKPALGVLRPIAGFVLFLPKAMKTVGSRPISTDRCSSLETG